MVTFQTVELLYPKRPILTNLPVSKQSFQASKPIQIVMVLFIFCVINSKNEKASNKKDESNLVAKKKKMSNLENYYRL